MTITLADLKRAVEELESTVHKFDQDPENVIIAVRQEGNPYNAAQIEAIVGGLKVVQAIRHKEIPKEMKP